MSNRFEGMPHIVVPTPSSDTSVPQFRALENSISMLDPIAADLFINRWLKSLSRPKKYPYEIEIVQPGALEMNPGVYCLSHAFVSDWKDNPALQNAYGSIYTALLDFRKMIPKNRGISFGPSPMTYGEENYMLIEARLI